MKFLNILSLLVFINSLHAQYDADRHNTSFDKGWISCSTKVSPNQVRGESHWIMYDFGQTYQLGDTKIWNANVADNTNIGIKNISIDYSSDGVSWIEYGVYEVDRSSASNFYTGAAGPDLTGLEARYILVTALSNYGGSCSGFSEIRFNTAGVVSDVTDIDELEGELLISPNPMEGTGKATLIDVESGDYIMQITDMGGRVIYREKINVSDDMFEVNLQLDYVVRGMYTLTISNGKRLKSKTFEIIK